MKKYTTVSHTLFFVVFFAMLMTASSAVSHAQQVDPRVSTQRPPVNTQVFAPEGDPSTMPNPSAVATESTTPAPRVTREPRARKAIPPRAPLTLEEAQRAAIRRLEKELRSKDAELARASETNTDLHKWVNELSDKRAQASTRADNLEANNHTLRLELATEQRRNSTAKATTETAETRSDVQVGLIFILGIAAICLLFKNASMATEYDSRLRAKLGSHIGATEAGLKRQLRTLTQQLTELQATIMIMADSIANLEGTCAKIPKLEQELALLRVAPTTASYTTSIVVPTITFASEGTVATVVHADLNTPTQPTAQIIDFPSGWVNFEAETRNDPAWQDVDIQAFWDSASAFTPKDQQRAKALYDARREATTGQTVGLASITAFFESTSAVSRDGRDIYIGLDVTTSDGIVALFESAMLNRLFERAATG